MKTYDLDATCPYCAAANDAVSDATDHGHAPQDGSASLCIQCGRFGIFEAHGETLKVRATTDEEHRELLADPEAIRVIAAWVAFGNR